MCAPFTAASHGFPATARLCIKIAVVSHSKLRKAAVASTAQCPAGCSLDHTPVGYYVIMPLDQPHSNVGLVTIPSGTFPCGSVPRCSVPRRTFLRRQMSTNFN